MLREQSVSQTDRQKDGHLVRPSQKPGLSLRQKSKRDAFNFIVQWCSAVNGAAAAVVVVKDIVVVVAAAFFFKVQVRM